MAEELIVAQGGKEEKYEVLYRQIEALMEGESDMIANMANVAAMIHSTFHFCGQASIAWWARNWCCRHFRAIWRVAV
jgi:putative methionine-R-sulfoxide reductase with GAF domain